MRRGFSFFDLLDYYNRFAFLHTDRFFSAPGFPFTYFAPGAVLYSALYHTGRANCLNVYLAAVLIGIGISLFLLQRNLKKDGLSSIRVNLLLAVALVTSYPFLFSLERGNLESLFALVLATGTWAYYKGHTRTAAILWGCAGSAKLYPLLFLAIFLSYRQYRQLAISLASAAVTTALSLLYVGPTIVSAQKGINHGVHAFIVMYSLQFSQEIGFDHSLFALLKLLASSWIVPSQALLNLYLLTLAVFMLGLYFLRIRKLPLTNQLLLLSICSITLPPTSFDYTLTELYAPWAAMLFLVSKPKSHNHLPASLSWAMALLALLFTPTNFLFHNGRTEAAQIKCVLLIILFILTLMQPFSPDDPSTAH